MENRDKKPPIRIVEEHKPGVIIPDDEPRYSRKSGGGTNWMPGIAGAVIAIIVSAVMVFMFNPAGKGVQTLSGQLAEVNNRVVALEGSLTQANQRIDNLINSQTGYATQDSLSGLASQQSVTDLSAQVAGLPTQLGDLTTQIAELEGRITGLETPPISPSNPEGTVRWAFEDPVLLGTIPTLPLDVIVYTFTDCERVEEEGLYEFTIGIGIIDTDLTTPYTTSFQLNNKIQLVLIPRDDALLDEDATYIDSDESPWTTWDSDFVIKTREGRDITKRVEFTSDKTFTASIAIGSEWEFDMVLELYYAD